MLHSILRAARKWLTTVSVCETRRVLYQTVAHCSLRHSENAPLQGLCRQSTLILWISLGRGSMISSPLCPILPYQRHSLGLFLFIRYRVSNIRRRLSVGLFMGLKCVWMQKSAKNVTGFCVALDVAQTLLQMDPLSKWAWHELSWPPLTNRQQPSNLKSLPQFSALVKTPALMMDVASLCESVVGWPTRLCVLCENEKSDLSVSMPAFVFSTCVNS